MLNGIVLGKASWDVDVAYSKFWTPEKYGVSFSKVLARPDQLMGLKKANGYKFLVATDLWSIKPRIALEHARHLGLKIFFIPREAFNFFGEFLFNDKRFLHNGQCYFTPDVVLAPGELYKTQWENKVKVYVTGHPRFDYCLYDNWVSKKVVFNKLGLSENLKTIFFPSYTIFTSKNLDKDKSFKKWGKEFGDVFDEREKLLKALLTFSNQRNDVQVVVKLHPMSSAALRKKGVTKDIEGISLKYLNNPTKKFRVIDGKKETRKMARDIVATSDFVVGSNTTMMVEAAFLGKPVLRALMGISDNLLNYPGYDNIFVSSNGFNDTIDKLHKMIDNNGVDFKTQNIDKYMKVDKKSCKRICKAITKEIGQ